MENMTAVASNNLLMALGVYRFGKKIKEPVLGEFGIACKVGEICEVEKCN